MTPETPLHEVVLNQMIAASVPAIVEPKEETAEQEDGVLPTQRQMGRSRRGRRVVKTLNNRQKATQTKGSCAARTCKIEKNETLCLRVSFFYCTFAAHIIRIHAPQKK